MGAVALNLFETKEPLSVTALSSQLKRSVEQQFRDVLVRGEISGAKKHTSGHTYFALKDNESVLDAVCWRGTSLPQAFADGLEVTARGRLTTYGARSKYQMIVENVEPAGQGALWQQFLALKSKLETEGLFNRPPKKLPVFPRHIGLITSSTGAVLQDIIHRLTERYPCHVTLWPVLVQGIGSAEQVAQAIQGMPKLKNPPEIIIVARGGGSLADLWTFNEEIVVRAAAACPLPIISAIGHETDTTLLDFAADYRAPTPTAAAEMATPVATQVRQHIQRQGNQLNLAWQRLSEVWALRVKAVAHQLVHPCTRLDHAKLKLDDLSERLDRAMNHWLTNTQQRIAYAGNRLNQADYHQALRKGFCYIQTQSGELIADSQTFKETENKRIGVMFQDGTLTFIPQSIAS